MFQLYNVDLAVARLSRTIVKVDGEFRYITGVEGGNRYIILYDIDGETTFRFPGCRIEYDRMPIGMLNMENRACWTYRFPVRRWKLGLNPGNYGGVDIGNEERYGGNTFFRNIGHIFNMLNGEYPHWDLACRHKGILGVSRQFAVGRKHIYYKTRRIGDITTSRRPELYEKYFYLRELLFKEVPSAVA